MSWERRIAFGVFVAVSMLSAGTAGAATSMFRTDLFLQTPVVNAPGIDSVRYLWSTGLTTGIVLQSDLIDLRMELYNGAALVYGDTVLSAGVFQPIGGFNRSVNDIFWRYDLDTLTLREMSNLFPAAAKLPLTVGHTFQVGDLNSLPIDGIVIIREHFGNDPTFTQSQERLASQSTSPVPEPGTVALLALGLACLGLCRRRS